jgi:hypothetical protein
MLLKYIIILIISIVLLLISMIIKEEIFLSLIVLITGIIGVLYLIKRV